MLGVNDDELKVVVMARAVTAPVTGTGKESKEPDHAFDRPGMIRAITDPAKRPNLEPKNFQLRSNMSSSTIDVNVPPREIMNKIPFFDAPFSSVYGAQQTENKLTAMKQKITEMGYSDEVAMIGLILTDANGISEAVNAIAELPDLPLSHQYVDRKSYTGSDAKEKHDMLNRFTAFGSRWPWTVPEEELCAKCGLPRELFHQGTWDFANVFGLEIKQPEEEVGSRLWDVGPRGSTVEDLIEKTETDEPLHFEASNAGRVSGTNDVPDMITCGICFDEMEKNKIFLAPCKHYYCKNCLRMHYKVKIMDGDVLRLPCPYLNEANENCGREIEEKEILYFCDEEMTAKYKKFKESKLIQLNDKARFCPKPGCEGWAVGSSWKPKLICEHCGFTYCWNCTNAWHGYFSRCVQNHDRAFGRFILTKDIQSCPKCRVKIWKNDGCNHMTCKFCKYEFCWLCRGKYTSNHFEPWNLMGCPGALYFPSWFRCPGFCPRSINRIMMFLCFIGVLSPIAIAFMTPFFVMFVTGMSLWIACWLVVCIPGIMSGHSECVTPVGCKDVICN